MELILKKDVENLGFKDDLVTVKSGYGRNYLIPQGYAVLATPSARKMLQETLKQRAFKEQRLIDEAKKQVESLKEMALKFPVKAGEGGKLFGSVTTSDISDLLSKNGFEIHKRYITISGTAIKQVGKYNVSLRLHRDVVTQIQLEVLPS